MNKFKRYPFKIFASISIPLLLILWIYLWLFAELTLVEKIGLSGLILGTFGFILAVITGSFAEYAYLLAIRKPELSVEITTDFDSVRIFLMNTGNAVARNFIVVFPKWDVVDMPDYDKSRFHWWAWHVGGGGWSGPRCEAKEGTGCYPGYPLELGIFEVKYFGEKIVCEVEMVADGFSKKTQHIEKKVLRFR